MKYNINVEYGNSLVRGNKLIKLISLLHSVKNLEADICEVGVYRGGTAKVLVNESKGTNVYLFDTFSGMPNYTPGIDNIWVEGTFNDIDYDQILKVFQKYNNVFIYKGIFPKETSHFILDNKFKFVHLDVDNYQSYKECLEFLYPKIISGGIIVFDDYDCDCCPGANKAIDEFFYNKPESIIKEDTTYIIKK